MLAINKNIDCMEKKLSSTTLLKVNKSLRFKFYKVFTQFRIF